MTDRTATVGWSPTCGAPVTPDPSVPVDAATSDASSDGSSDTAAAPEVGSRRARRRATRFVFMDTEATGLDHTRHELTEVAWIVRFEDGREEERRYFPEHTTDGADADALELTRYTERIAPQDKTPARVWLTEFLEHADGAVLVGAVPDFDAQHLARTCRKLGLEPTWDHHLLDVETLALPFIAPGPESPRSLAKTCQALGIPHDRDQAHGALYDAQQARAVFDAVWELTARLRASGDPLPPPVPREERPAAARTPEVSTEDATARAVEASGATDTGQPDQATG
ncbi:3'-5' exonuclease [Nitriliruptoraceae bacterium ZYF776]|nr:3'-5' exonuclease [Profundirhabdus halotolerans]